MQWKLQPQVYRVSVQGSHERCGAQGVRGLVMWHPWLAHIRATDCRGRQVLGTDLMALWSGHGEAPYPGRRLLALGHTPRGKRALLTVASWSCCVSSSVHRVNVSPGGVARHGDRPGKRGLVRGGGRRRSVEAKLTGARQYQADCRDPGG